jgi:hypothetical protein
MQKNIKVIIIVCLGLVLFSATSYSVQPTEDTKWKSFDCSAGDEFNLSFGQYIATIKSRDIHLPAPDREDKLTMIIRKGNETILKHDFISSYGRGQILIKSGYIFLEYGIGRGTGVREEHVKAYSLLAEYEYIEEPVEIFEVQKSYRLPPHKPIASPYYVEYKVRFIEDKENLKVVFYGAEKGYGIPERKEIILKKMVNN